MLFPAELHHVEYCITLTLVLLANSVQPTTISLLSDSTFEPDLGSASGSRKEDVKTVNLVSARFPFTNVSSATNRPKLGWNSETMPNPWSCPSCCGISQPGWICDPDGVFQYKVDGSDLKLADQLNYDLWREINSSVCPCQNSRCQERNVTVFVAVVKKLLNPNNYSAGELIYDFAQSLQRMWGASDTDCRTEIIIALSVQDSAMTTILGRDITSTGMMRYEDVTLIGGITQTIVPDANLFETVRFLIRSYGLYINHPVEHSSDGNVTDNGPGTNMDDNDTLEPGIIVLIVISVLLVFVALGIVALPFYCRSSVNACKKKEKPES